MLVEFQDIFYITSIIVLGQEGSTAADLNHPEHHWYPSTEDQQHW